MGTDYDSHEDIENDILEDMVEQSIVEDAKEKEDEEKAKTQKEYDELLDKLQRNMAEFDNFRKRTLKEKSEMYDAGVRDTVEKILPTMDNLDRALQTITDTESSTYKGVDMIIKQFTQSMEDIGVKYIECVGEKFDPNKHFAVAHVDDDKFSENEITIEMQKGYLYKEKVIRHSMVQVAN